MEELIQRIGITEFVQIIIEAWNSIFLLIMIFSLVSGKRADASSERVKNVKIPLTNEIIVFFSAIFLYNTLNLLCCTVSGDTSSYGLIMKPAAELAYFAVGEFQTLFFLQVVKKHIAEKNGMKKLKNAFTVVQLLNLPLPVLLAVTPFTNALYYFDEQNYYHRGTLYPVWYYTTIVSFAFIFAVYLFTRRKADKFLRQVITVSAVIPLIAFICNFVYTGISFNNISVSVTALIIFMMYEKNRSNVLAESIRETESVKRQLAESKLELEHNKNVLLMAQIQPHFITNSLMALRARCSDNHEVYESLTNFSRYLRSNFEALGEVSLISFEKEMQNIEAYLALEKDNFGDRLNIVYDITFDGFLVPALSVQPLVENAVRHGVGTYDKGGTVRIGTYRDGDNIVVEITDDGSGKSNITEKQKDRKGIGIKNVQSRLSGLGYGKLDIISSENGTTAKITLTDPKLVENN